MPPKPDVSLSDLTPVRWSGPGHSYGGQPRFSAQASRRRRTARTRESRLRLRGVDYAKGIGTHAPNQMIFEVKPEYDRFVALAGVDERILQVSNGSNLARYPSVVFKVFVDGREAASSPVMRIAEQPWRFDVRLPAGAKRISLAPRTRATATARTSPTGSTPALSRVGRNREPAADAFMGVVIESAVRHPRGWGLGRRADSDSILVDGN